MLMQLSYPIGAICASCVQLSEDPTENTREYKLTAGESKFSICQGTFRRFQILITVIEMKRTCTTQYNTHRHGGDNGILKGVGK